MKNFIIFSSLAALAAAFPAAPPPIATPVPMPRVTFRLRADPANKEVASLGFLDKSVGFPKVRTGDYRAFYDEEHQTVNTTDGSGILWLRPTHGTPMYYVFNGDPMRDAIPALTIWKWKMITEGGKQYLGQPNFMACGDGSEVNKYLYFGPQVGPPRCTNNFKFEVVWDVKPDEPTYTVTCTETATETATETETSTCITETATETPTETATETPTETCTEEPTETATETEEPTLTITEEPTDEPTETATETEIEETTTSTEVVIIPTGTDGPIPPPGDNTTVTIPPVPTETNVDEIPESGSGMKSPTTGLFALVVAAGMAVFVL